MPRISEFYGIAIYLYYRDHLPPHFHAIYGQYEASVAIDTGAVIDGYLPSRALALVREWSARYRVELRDDWELARSHQPLRPVPPLV